MKELRKQIEILGARISRFVVTITEEALHQYPDLFQNYHYFKNTIADTNGKIFEQIHFLESQQEKLVLFNEQIENVIKRVILCDKNVEEGFSMSLNQKVNFLKYILTELYEISYAIANISNQVANRLVTEQQALLETLKENASNQIFEIQSSQKFQEEKFNELTKALQEEINSIKETNSTLLAEKKIEKQKVGFGDIADDAKKRSEKWITATIVIIILLIGFSIFFSWCFGDDFKKAFDASKADNFLLSQEKVLFYFELAKRTLVRFLVITILLVLLKYCLKNYNSLMHSYAVNMHKASCLDSALTIMRGFENPNTKELVMTLASKEIFTMGKTGYLKNEETKFDLKVMDKIGASGSSKESEG
ncbi:hypothetical protein ACFOW1_09685 [Parasediminibacterium paludis]|uniref:Uncharacterized protein n=1 Tax=Parasediminibacterium paludis TaxID=908966 RepID=A0ABV8PYZ5_9BACT